MVDDTDSSNIPDGLRPDGEGARLWTWLSDHADGVLDSMPLAVELCRVADRLQEVRSKLDAQGLAVSGARGRSARNPLIDSEIKLSKQFQALWRALGLSDKSDVPARPVGRPPSGELWPG
jgi:hypothetical protein